MLKKSKKVILSVLLAVMMLSTYLVASAAEPSEKVMEDGKHSVYAFGKSVVFIVGDTIEIVPNNDTKMIDVMIDGKVFKGLQRLELKSTEGNKVVPEEGSIILECDSKEQAQELKDKIATGMENNTPVTNIADLVGEEENVAAFMIDESGNLVDDNGNAVTGNNAPKVEVDSVSNASEEFQEEQQELQEEIKQQEERERQEEIRQEKQEERQAAEEAAKEASKATEVIVPPASAEPSTDPSGAPEYTDAPEPSVEPSVAPSVESTDQPENTEPSVVPSLGGGNAA
ncbi:MAG: hypothetical protein IJO65_08230 [Lachnospiraceae bacterium]|nr:hypothetical protein [Lachnospiraceae bacterium]